MVPNEHFADYRWGKVTNKMHSEWLVRPRSVAQSWPAVWFSAADSDCRPSISYDDFCRCHVAVLGKDAQTWKHLQHDEQQQDHCRPHTTYLEWLCYNRHPTITWHWVQHASNNMFYESVCFKYWNLVWINLNWIQQ